MVMSLICSWVCSVSFLFFSLYWKNDYVEWHIWFSVIFCAIYFSMTCAVCVYQAISQNKWCSEVILASVIFVVIAVLFGAHPMQNHLGTILWAVLMSLFCCVPSASMFDVYRLKRMSSTSTLVVACTLLGSWVGAFTIALDWEKPWQVWPIPCNFGATVGHVLGVSLSLLFEWQDVHTKSTKAM
ncbi:phosphatidylinositol-glycan biosynthesis class F protein-like isoform X2 [Dysidea avara]|uniref:phosphatidylinositol-glycan biosynthesis class F protein-like isoform X2 n=1 Tax=Dysidea avara TaxID=196820 RepID=UPI00331D0BC9